jgi:hypothetical protein
MIPDGTPANSFSARRAMAASSGRGTAGRSGSGPALARTSSESGLTSSVRASATEHSSAADDDSPAPSARAESMARLAPGTGWPAASSDQATPAGYRAQPGSPARISSSAAGVPSGPGRSRASGISTLAAGSRRVRRASTSSRRGEAAATMPWPSANGSTKPSL